MIIVNGFQPLTIITITKRSILDVAAALDPPLIIDVWQGPKYVFALYARENFFELRVYFSKKKARKLIITILVIVFLSF